MNLRISRFNKLNIYFSTLFFFIFIVQINTSWVYLGKTKINFGDLEYVLSRVKCTTQVGRAVFNLNPPGTLCGNYIYGYPLLEILHLFRINLRFLIPLASILVVMLIYNINFKVTHKGNIVLKIFVLLIFLSPPTVLLIQRGNIDLLVVFILMLSIKLMDTDKKKLGVLLIFLSALIKFYTFPVGIYFLYKMRDKSIAFKFLVLVALLTSISILKDISSLPFLPWDARNMFGSPIWGEYFVYFWNGPNTHANPIFSHLLGGVLICLIIFLIKKVRAFYKIGKLEKKYFPVQVNTTIETYLIVFLSCYFSGLNVDYRLIYFSLFILSYLNNCGYSLIRYIFAFVAITPMLYFSFNVGDIQVFGDIAILFSVSYLLSRLSITSFKRSASVKLN